MPVRAKKGGRRNVTVPLPPGRAATILKRLRVAADLSIREMARELGLHPASKYQYYEDRYKRDYLPSELFLTVRTVLMRRGISRADVYQLLPETLQKELAMMGDELTAMHAILRRLDAVQAAAEEPEPPDPNPPRRRPPLNS